MGHLQCNCGIRLSNSTFPNTLEGDLTGSYEHNERSVWECPECGRLAIKIKDEDDLTIIKWYMPEDGKIGNLFNIGREEDSVNHLKKLWRLWKKEFLLIEIGDL